MTRSPKWSPRIAVLATTAALVFAACGGSTTSPSAAPASETPASEAPASAPASTEAFTPMVYPETGEAPCGQAAAPDATHDKYAGEFKKITAVDAKTVVFDLCNPDVAFLSKIAFSSFAINDTAWIQSHVDPNKPDNQAIVDQVNGTGPYKLDAWNRGSDVTMSRFDNYWGDKAKTEKLIIRWSSEAAQRLVELLSPTVDGIDNVGPTDFDTVKNNPDLQLKERPGLNTFYVGMNNTFAPFDNEKVRQAIAMGIDRQRIVDNFYPPGSEVATHFTPCAIPNGCAGDDWYEYDPAKAKQLLADAGFPNGFDTVLNYRDVVRSYLPDPKVVATDIQAQLKKNLNITVKIEVQESGTFLDNAAAGKLQGLHLLGWGVDYPDITDFLDYHFGAGASKQFGNKWDDVTSALTTGGQGANDDARKPAYEAANNAIRTHVPMIPIAHGGSGVAYRADVQNAHSSPLGNEYFAVMTPADRTQFVFMQNAEPPGLYCADETDGESLRVCEQMTEALYGYEVGGSAAIPALATECKPNAELTQWTCTLRDGVTFHDGSTLDANDVVLSYAVQWDADSPLHKGRTGDFTYFPGLFGGFLNPPVPAE
jgi:peptide/nickel transport system substrate-binding protein